MTSCGGEIRTIAKKRERGRFATSETRIEAGGRSEERIRKPRREPSMTVRVLARARREIDTVKTSEPHTLVRAARCVRTAVLRRVVTSETSCPEANERSGMPEAFRSAGCRVASRLGAGARRPYRDDDVRSRHIEGRGLGSSYGTCLTTRSANAIA